MNLSEINDKNMNERSMQYAYNGGQNWQRIKDEAAKHPMSLSSLPPLEGMPVLVTGSGPSLDDAMPYLKDFPGPIFSSLSQVNIMEKWGIKPMFYVAYDSADDAADVLSEGQDLSSSILLTFTGISPKVLARWPSRVRYFLNDCDRYDPQRFPWINISFPLLGCVSNLMVKIAHYFRASMILLAGVDYCYPDGRKRAQDYRRRGPFIFEPKPLEYVPTEEGKVSSSEEQLFYAAILYALWKGEKMGLVRVGDKSALELIPSITPDKIGHSVLAMPTPDSTWDKIDEFTTELGLFSDVADGRMAIHFKAHDIEAEKAAHEVGWEWTKFWNART